MASGLNNTDWFTYTLARPVGPLFYYIQLPAFSQAAGDWLGAGIVIFQYNFAAPADFYIFELPEKPADNDYLLCIRWRVGETVYRYKLWEDDRAKLNAPLLAANTLVRANFVLEVWSVEGESVVSQTEAINIDISRRFIPSDYRDFSQASYADGEFFDTLENNNTVSLPDTNLAIWSSGIGVGFESPNVTYWLANVNDAANGFSYNSGSFNGTADDLVEGELFNNEKYLRFSNIPLEGDNYIIQGGIFKLKTLDGLSSYPIDIDGAGDLAVEPIGSVLTKNFIFSGGQMLLYSPTEATYYDWDVETDGVVYGFRVYASSPPPDVNWRFNSNLFQLYSPETGDWFTPWIDVQGGTAGLILDPFP